MSVYSVAEGLGESKQQGGAGAGLGAVTPLPLGRPLSRRLSPQDAAFFHFESDEAPMNVGFLGVFEGEVPFDKFVDNIASKLHLVPRYRQRVVPAPLGIARPTWEYDPDFDIGRHIRRLRLEPPGTDEQLMELAARLYAGRLDRGKPLWQICFVEGLQGGRTGVFAKVHHCLVDGVGGIDLLMVTLDLSPDPPPLPAPAEPGETPPIPGRAALFLDAVFDSMAERVDGWASFQRGLVDLALGGDIEGARTVRRALEVATPYFVLPVTPAPFNGPFSGGRKLACSEISFQEVRAVRKACGGTVNDVVLAVLGGALRRYLELHGEATRGRLMRIVTPVNVRRLDERGTFGNRITLLALELPVGVRDPLALLRAVTERTGELKRDHVADGVERAAGFLVGLPAPLISAASSLPLPSNRVAHMVCTNVPGPMIPLYTVGHRLLAAYPLLPLTWEMGIGCAVMSYNQKLYFSLVADAGAGADVGRLKGFLDEAWLELRAAAKVEEPALPEILPATEKVGSRTAAA